MKPKVYITRRLPQVIIDKLSSIFEVKMWGKEEEPVPREILIEEVQQIDGLFCLLTETIDQELLANAQHLKIIANMAVGYNNIDIQAATEKGIKVTNTPGVLTETTADLTFALLMATARRVVEASDYLRNGKWETWAPMQLTGQDIYGATIGIIGMGRIGQALAKRAKGFDMKIIYSSRTRKSHLDKKLGMEYVELNDLLKQSDFVSILIPYTNEVHHLIGENELRLMKKSAILINTARGGIVDETALYNALKKGDIWAAGLDVFEQEPLSLVSPLLTLPNVVTLPHIGSASKATRLKMADMAAENIIRVLSGEAALTPVN
ncbi:D-glycerate dehydrogenase [Bacillus sp. FJAT-49736]|uniref:2-hydroxyacid dehydrogenase n=1 Tax=Bacillus sp. FJAT-49736 TaxID=2833582 RepID=UPI001BC95D5C|nr:D-glycerate dehydrogenase [Bacillus sp. FJAT-49736]MBS4174446.1 D-glycerate dehydrogenase [Bacillus sp. FJAT-49736]MBS4175803.1 D-glycerate dehydrogenase [Bacillus sp. FJAT-49736]